MSIGNSIARLKPKKGPGERFQVRYGETAVALAFRWQRELDNELKRKDVLIDRLLTLLQPHVHPAVWRSLHEDF